MDKLSFQGTIRSIQPRIRLNRSFDEVAHNYLGYAILLIGRIDGEERAFQIGIGKSAQEKFQLKVEDVIGGACLPVADPKMEPVEFYKVSKLKKHYESHLDESGEPPYLRVPPDLETYRARGHRRLSARSYETRCRPCVWGCRMPVEITVDQWNPKGSKKFRYETFCYGPLNCSFYKAGPLRKVPGRKGMVFVEEDWLDEMRVSHRHPDD